MLRENLNCSANIDFLPLFGRQCNLTQILTVYLYIQKIKTNTNNNIGDMESKVHKIQIVGAGRL